MEHNSSQVLYSEKRRALVKNDLEGFQQRRLIRILETTNTDHERNTEVVLPLKLQRLQDSSRGAIEAICAC